MHTYMCIFMMVLILLQIRKKLLSYHNKHIEKHLIQKMTFPISISISIDHRYVLCKIKIIIIIIIIMIGKKKTYCR